MRTYESARAALADEGGLQAHGGSDSFDTEPQVFMLGYEGRSLSEVLEIVRTRGIELVLDVRENAQSRKVGFDSISLEGALSGIGVRYAHLPELGCEQTSRHALWRGGAASAFLERYRRRLSERPQALEDLVDRVGRSRTLLLCLERDASRCHRAVLDERLRQEGFAVESI